MGTLSGNICKNEVPKADGFPVATSWPCGEAMTTSHIVFVRWHFSAFPMQPVWWFGTFFIFPNVGNNHPNWLICFRGVETTNQQQSHQKSYIMLQFWKIPCKKKSDVAGIIRTHRPGEGANDFVGWMMNDEQWISSLPCHLFYICLLFGGMSMYVIFGS